jgi:hypothetical protein
MPSGNPHRPHVRSASSTDRGSTGVGYCQYSTASDADRLRDRRLAHVVHVDRLDDDPVALLERGLRGVDPVAGFLGGLLQPDADRFGDGLRLSGHRLFLLWWPWLTGRFTYRP